LRNATNEVNGQEDRQKQKEREANKGKQNKQNRHDAETNINSADTTNVGY